MFKPTRPILLLVTLTIMLPHRGYAEEYIGPRTVLSELPEATRKVIESAIAKIKSPSRVNYSHGAFESFEFFPNSKTLHQGLAAWSPHFDVIVPPKAKSGSVLSLRDTPAWVGDIVLLGGDEPTDKPRVLVYLGEVQFPDESKSRSFFIYPYSEKGGLEVNTFPPRWNYRLLVKYGVLSGPPAAEVEEPGTDREFEFEKQGTVFGFKQWWLKSPKLAGSLFVRSSWWNGKGTYRVLRAHQPRFDRTKFFTAFRNKFGNLNQSQTDGIEALLGFIERDKDVTDVRWIAYMLATVRVETANKWQAKTVESGNKDYFKQYDHVLGNKGSPDGYTFRGRGYVQLTGRANYKTFGSLLTLDLEDHPEKAGNPATAYRIMSIGMRNGTFRAKKLTDYFTDSKSDYAGARDIVNGDGSYTRQSKDGKYKDFIDSYVFLDPNLSDVGDVFRALGKAFEKILRDSDTTMP